MRENFGKSAATQPQNPPNWTDVLVLAKTRCDDWNRLESLDQFHEAETPHVLRPRRDLNEGRSQPVGKTIIVDSYSGTFLVLALSA